MKHQSEADRKRLIGWKPKPWTKDSGRYYRRGRRKPQGRAHTRSQVASRRKARSLAGRKAA